MVDLRRRVMDNIKVLQDESPTIICPLADQACLGSVNFSIGKQTTCNSLKYTIGGHH